MWRDIAILGILLIAAFGIVRITRNLEVDFDRKNAFAMVFLLAGALALMITANTHHPEGSLGVSSFAAGVICWILSWMLESADYGTDRAKYRSRVRRAR
jgi:hypothetical protein